MELTIYNRKTRFSFRERNGLQLMKNQVLVNLIMKCVSQFFFSKYNSKWAQAAESNQAEEVDGSLPRNVFPNKTAGPHYTLMSLKTPHCTSIFSSGPIMRSHPLPPSQLLSFSSTHLIITICSIFTITLVGKSFLWCAVSSHLWKVQRQFFKEEK